MLVVDDAAFMRMMLAKTLTGLGYEVDEAGDGLEAVEKIKQNDYELVTLDITMPNLDGIGALKEIKKIKSNIPVVMCSAMGQEAMVVEAIKFGAIDFIVKPFKPDRIAKMMTSLAPK